jgi:SAM-dependent methyltransferase
MNAPTPGTPNVYRCPKCRGELAAKAQVLTCVACASAFRQIEGYYDFFLNDRTLPETEYPPELEPLRFSAERILALPEPGPSRFLSFIFRRRRFNTGWAADLAELKNTVKKYGADEKNRVEFMEDDRSAAGFIEQKKNSAAKAKLILRSVLRLPRGGNRVLHVGCGGECNIAIPRAYQEAGFVNYGVDAVRSYVREFGAVGEAQLANASALPYADETFDIVNYTDILEHLFDPLAGLREASRVLKKNGLLVLGTPNRMYLQRKNPCSWLEYFLGRIRPGLLRPRIITARWQNEVLFHTQFTKGELRTLFKYSGLQPINFETEILAATSQDTLRVQLKRTLVFYLERIAPTNKWLLCARKI